MIVALEDYLRNQMPGRKSEIEQIGETAGAVLETFDLAFDGIRKAWPYRIDRGIVPAAAKPSEYSFSTNSMVLFALKALLGEYEHSVLTIGSDQPSLSWLTGNVALLTPMLARPDQDLIVPLGKKDIEPEQRRELWEKLISRFHPLIEKTASTLTNRINQQLSSKASRLTRSGTFGDNDPFTLCWVLESVEIQKSWIPHLGVRVGEALKRPRDFQLGAGNNAASTHALPLLRGLQMYALLRRLGLCQEIPLTDIKDWFEGRIHEHLSYASMPDSSFDAPELIFALEGLLICEPESLGIGRLLERVLEVIQEKQQHNPNLRPYRPILSDERGRALLPLTIEVFSSLLRIFERLASDNSRLISFDPVHSILKRYAQWLLGQRCYIDIPSGVLSGWNSEHTNVRHCIHVWETSQVILFLAHYRRLLRAQLQRDILDAANFTRMRPQLQSYMPRTESECTQKEPCKAVFLYRQIWKDFIAPRASLSIDQAKYSMLLFGPPGTGKTTFAEYLAGMLGWELIILSPSDFIERGDQGVEARAKVIFASLQELSEKVILFDEIDRLILDRDSPEYARQDDIFKFMTPSMLTKLRTLRRLEKSIFIVATNYEDRIDLAAKRHGRIDDRIPVLPPDKIYRNVFLTSQLKKRGWEKPSAELWKRAVEKSALYTFPELNDALKRTFDGKPSSQAAISAFIDYLDQQTAEIKLATYVSRFGWEIVSGKARPKKRGLPSQVPKAEFRALYEIALENPKFCDPIADAIFAIC